MKTVVKFAICLLALAALSPRIAEASLQGEIATLSKKIKRKQDSATEKSWCPKGYKITMTVTADFDGDGVEETAYAAEPIQQPDLATGSDDRRPAPVVSIVRAGHVLYSKKLSYHNDSGTFNTYYVGRLAAETITGGAHPALLFDGVRYYADGYNSLFYAVVWRNGKFVPVADGIQTIEGFTGIFRKSKSKPAVLVSSYPDWASNESHADRHRYHLEEIHLEWQ